MMETPVIGILTESSGGSSNLNDESWKRTGYCGLGRAITQLGLQSFSPINIDFVVSLTLHYLYW